MLQASLSSIARYDGREVIPLPGKKMRSIKNKKQYEALRKKGMPKSKAAAIANSGKRKKKS